MAKRSAGLLPYVVEHRDGLAVLRVMLVHPGGPFWAKKDAASWSICKGEMDEPDEDPRSTARREFLEELGHEPPPGEWLELGEAKQPSGKSVVAWAVGGYLDVTEIASNQFSIEWPPRSGKVQSFPEVDRAQWFDAAEARWRILKGQVVFIDALLRSISGESLSEGDPGAP